MTPEAYNAYTDALTQRLRNTPHVLGLVLLGSAAVAARRDAYSDHDFFVIVEMGHQAAFRRDLSWLPDSAPVLFQFQETEHGLKVIDTDGHLVEFAVFDRNELLLARVNEYRVVFDNTDDSTITPTLEHLRTQSQPAPLDITTESYHLLSNLYVAALRARRGERLSAHHGVHAVALPRLLRMIVATVPAERDEDGEFLDAARRFERIYPTHAHALHAALEGPPQAVIVVLMTLARRILPHEPYPVAAHDAVHRLILSLWADRTSDRA